MSLVRRPVFLVALAATVAVIVVLPMRYVPVLPRYEFSVIGGAMYILASATLFVVADGVRRRGSISIAELAIPTLVAALVAAAAVAYFISIGGSGTPTIAIVVGPAAVFGATVFGAFVGRMEGTSARLAAIVLSMAVLAAGISVLGAGTPRETGGATACEDTGSVEYCAYPGYEGFVEHWAAAVDPVLAQVPQTVRSNMVLVTQRFDRQPSPAAFATPKSDWGRGNEQGRAELDLALDAANWAVGLRRDIVCDPSGQGRGIVAWWLAGQVSDAATEVLVAGAEGVAGSRFADPYLPDGRELAAQLLQRPSDDVGSQVRESWAAVTSPRSTLADVARIFGLTGAQATRFATRDACV